MLLTPAGSLLDLHIRDPQTNFNSSMRELLPELYYRITYWEAPAHLQVAGAAAAATGCPSVCPLTVRVSVPPQGWLQSSPEQRPPLPPPAGGVMVLNSSSNLVTLPGLRSWTWYCASVQSVASFQSKISRSTAPLCRQTEGTALHLSRKRERREMTG